MIQMLNYICLLVIATELMCVCVCVIYMYIARLQITGVVLSEGDKDQLYFIY